MVLFRGYQPYWSPVPESPESGVWLAVSADDLLRGPPDYVWVWPGLVTSCQSDADFLCRRTKRDYWLRDTFGVCYPCHLFSWLDNVSKDECLIEKQKQNQAPHFLKHIILGICINFGFEVFFFNSVVRNYITMNLESRINICSFCLFCLVK